MTQIQPNPTKSSSSTTETSSRSTAEALNLPNEIDKVNRTLLSLIKPKDSEQNKSDDGSSSVQINETTTLVYLVFHTVLINNGFKLKQIRSSSDGNQANDGNSIDLAALNSNPQSFHPKYFHNQSSLSFEFSFSKIGNRVSVCALITEDDRLSTLDLSISEYLDESKFPLNLSLGSSSSRGLYNSEGFRSTSHLLNLVSIFINQILHNLLPDLIPKTSIRPSATARNGDSSPTNDGHTASRPNREENLSRPQFYHNDEASSNMRNPLEIGRSDLDPIGASNIRIPSIYNAPPSNVFPSQGSDGMIVGPNHSIFNDRNSTRPSNIFGGDAFLPDNAVPPGARFDPVGPQPYHSRPGRGSIEDFDPMGGLSQGLPLGNPHPGRNYPGRGNFNEFRPPGGPSGFDDHMFM